jgi:hypothetical protein
MCLCQASEVKPADRSFHGPMVGLEGGGGETRGDGEVVGEATVRLESKTSGASWRPLVIDAG